VADRGVVEQFRRQISVRAGFRRCKRSIAGEQQAKSRDHPEPRIIPSRSIMLSTLAAVMDSGGRERAQDDLPLFRPRQHVGDWARAVIATERRLTRCRAGTGTPMNTLTGEGSMLTTQPVPKPQPGPHPRPAQEPPTRPGQRPVEDPPERGPVVPETPDSPPATEPPTRPGTTPIEDPPTGPDTIG
jgi:hypothetical protein